MLHEKVELINVKEACQFLKIKESHLRSLVFRRQIYTIRIGRLLRFRKDKLIEWLESNRQDVETK